MDPVMLTHSGKLFKVCTCCMVPDINFIADCLTLQRTSIVSNCWASETHIKPTYISKYQSELPNLIYFVKILRFSQSGQIAQLL